jgi:RNA polymerase sigma factor (sigma-70 family)
MAGLAEMEARLKRLMLSALAGDATAYRELLRDLSGGLRSYFSRRLPVALSANGEDLVQDTLMAIHAKRHTFDTTAPLTAWVYAIARHKLIDHLRRSRMRATVPLEDSEAFLAIDNEHSMAARLDVDHLLASMPARSSRLVQQVRIEGATIAEAAAVEGMTETAAKVSIHRTLKALAARIGRATR